MAVKIFVLFILAVILGSLGAALYSMLKGADKPTHTVRALTIRIVLSIGLFIFLIVSFAFGWITPHGMR